MGVTEVPSDPKVAESLKLFGKVISDEARKAGGFVSPLLAAFTARMVSLGTFFCVCGTSPACAISVKVISSNHLAP